MMLNAFAMLQKELQSSLEDPHLSIFKEKARLAKQYAEQLVVCKHCGDVTLYSPVRHVCRECWDEMVGKSNGMKLLGGKGFPKVKRGSDDNTKGMSGKMGHHGVAESQWSNMVRAMEDQ